MTESSELPGFAEMTLLLQKINPNANAAYFHGFICGMISIPPVPIMPLLKKIFPTTKNVKKIQQYYQALAAISTHELTEFSFKFTLLLPPDDADLKERAESLGLWCQGFLTGLAQDQAFVQQHLTEDLQAAIDDITEIAQLSFGDVIATEEEETAYVELVAHIQLSALLVFHELQPPLLPTTKNDNQKPRLH